MPRRVLCAALVAAALAAPPAVALADSGPSAGDSQYVDPLAGNSQSGTHHSSSGPATAPAPSPGSSSGTPAPSSSGTPAPSSTASPAPSSTATAAASSAGSATTSTAAGDPHHTLPFTGLDADLVALIGAGLAGGGLVLRRGLAARG
jgi:hypothetical protein